MNTTQVAFRFENTLVDRLDAFASQIASASGMKASRADAVRILIEAALAASEGKPFQLPMGLSVAAPKAKAQHDSPSPKAKKPPGKAKPHAKPDAEKAGE